jgi:hypothetical protein
LGTVKVLFKMAPMDIYPFHGATGLPSVITCTVDSISHCKLHVGIFGNVGRVLASKLKSHINEPLCSLLIDR